MRRFSLVASGHDKSMPRGTHHLGFGGKKWEDWCRTEVSRREHDGECATASPL